MARFSTTFVVLFFILVQVVSPGASSGQELREELGILRPFLDGEWEGRFEDADEPLGLSMQWEVILDGQAVRMDGRSSGMTRTPVGVFA